MRMQAIRSHFSAVALTCALLLVMNGCLTGSGPSHALAKERLLGGLEAERPVDASVRKIAQTVKSAVMTNLEEQNLQVTQYVPISYKSQVVAGVNYFIKIQVNDDPASGYVHARVFRSLQGTSQLVGLETGHSASDPIGAVPTFV